MYRIAILSDHDETGQRLVEQTKRFCIKHGLFPMVELYFDREEFFQKIPKTTPVSVILALPGVAGLNAAEHLRSLCPECGLIWCSDLDFSLHAFKLRAEYFILAPVTEEDLQEGLSIWMGHRNRSIRKRGRL